MLQREKEVLAEILQLYKESPVLWNKKDLNYKKNDVRMKAYQVLFERYKTVYVGQGIKDLKRKIENMRTSWYKERKKIDESRRKGEKPVYTPTLWYFHMLDFLNLNSGDSTSAADNTDSENTFVFEDNVEYLEPLDSDEEYEPAEKKPKYVSMIDFDSNHQNRRTENDYERDPLDRPMSSETVSRQESQAFGRMVGLQLQELDRFQRTVAQKLISDVIFYARLNKLSDHSYLSDV